MNRPRPSVAELREAVAQVELMPLKDRRKAARSLGGMALGLEGAGALTARDEIELGIKALALCAGSHSFPQKFQLARARLAQQRRQSFGLPEPVIAFEQARTLDVEIGGILVDDSARDPVDVLRASVLHDFLNKVGAYFVSFGGDGAVKVRLRVHSSGPAEPQLSEMRKLREAAVPGRLQSESGEAVVFGGSRKTLTFALEQGTWDIAAFGLGMGRRPECLLIVAPESGAVSPLHDTPALMI